MSRALNRHHQERMKRRRANYHTAGDRSVRSIGIVTTTPKTCSCWLCRNKRGDEGPTIQERQRQY